MQLTIIDCTNMANSCCLVFSQVMIKGQEVPGQDGFSVDWEDLANASSASEVHVHTIEFLTSDCEGKKKRI